MANGVSLLRNVKMEMLTKNQFRIDAMVSMLMTLTTADPMATPPAVAAICPIWKNRNELRISSKNISTRYGYRTNDGPAEAAGAAATAVGGAATGAGVDGGGAARAGAAACGAGRDGAGRDGADDICLKIDSKNRILENSYLILDQVPDQMT